MGQTDTSVAMPRLYRVRTTADTARESQALGDHKQGIKIVSCLTDYTRDARRDVTRRDVPGPAVPSLVPPRFGSDWGE